MYTRVYHGGHTIPVYMPGYLSLGAPRSSPLIHHEQAGYTSVCSAGWRCSGLWSMI